MSDWALSAVLTACAGRDWRSCELLGNRGGKEMSDLNEWLKERRAIHELGNDVLLRNSYELERETDLGIRDAKAVEDGFNTLPTLLTAVENVLKLHTETVHGECAICFECTYNDGYEVDYSPFDYPCPTVQAIEGAIK